MLDPFYSADSTGILVYDASGWMSVQIAGAAPAGHGRSGITPDTRHAEGRARSRPRYSILITPTLAPGTMTRLTSTVTHHVKSSLIPGETGISYSQTVTLEGGRLIFTTRREAAGGAAVQKKVWQRISAPNG